MLMSRNTYHLIALNLLIDSQDQNQLVLLYLNHLHHQSEYFKV